MSQYFKIFVVCPGGVVTGGPELLHQLVHELRGFGLDAYISYYPFTHSYEIPLRYAMYSNVKQCAPELDCENIIVLPESATRLIYRYKKMRIMIWWQSVDNYYQIPPQNGWRRWIPRKLGSFLSRAPLRHLKAYENLVQSEYARLHLAGRGIESKRLGDYLSTMHVHSSSDDERMDVIAYNPKKGMEISRRLISALPFFEFIPIQDMSAEQVNSLLSRVKVYMDFGNHPGRDRMPREAAIAGACVVTGVRGAAGNPVDILIPQKYKLNDDEYLVENFSSRVCEIFYDFRRAVQDFEAYRSEIRSERRKFSEQCALIFAGRRVCDTHNSQESK